MSYLEYVIGAYLVFVAVLLWDMLSPQLQIRRELRNARLRARRRDAARAAPAAPANHETTP
ncbi:MAG: heme exporter protein CcmD [Pseudoxanthomonas suwonensis]|nr:heme exporter protein CcmD [Pseudoxanthomonas suwonensis]